MSLLCRFPIGWDLPCFVSTNLRLSPASISTTQGFEVTVNVKNTGEVDGKEVVQVYLTDTVSSVVTPNTFLAGFQKVNLPYACVLSSPLSVSCSDLRYPQRRYRQRRDYLNIK